MAIAERSVVSKVPGYMLLLLLVLLLWAATLLVPWLIPVIPWPESARAQVQPGTFGDMFGAANALFSGLAFAGVVWAIRTQQADIEHSAAVARQATEETRRAAVAALLSD